MNNTKIIEQHNSTFKDVSQANENKLRIYEKLEKKKKAIKTNFRSLSGQINEIRNDTKFHKRDAMHDLIMCLNSTFKRNSNNKFSSSFQSKEKEKINLINCFSQSNKTCLSKIQINTILARKFIEHLQSINDFDSIKDNYVNKIGLNIYKKIRSSIECILTEEIKEILYNIFLESKNSDSISLAASNAITILNKSGFSFTNKDLSRIKIPNADLSWGLFINTNFESSYLYGVNFSQANIYDSNFRNCNMINVNFGKTINSGLEEKYKIIIFSPCGRFLAGALENKIILYEAKTNLKIKQFAGIQWNIEFLLFSDNGNYLVSSIGGNKTILWDTSKMIQISTISKIGEFCCFSPCNNYICFIWGQIVKIYSIKTKKIIKTIQWLGQNLEFVSFTPSMENLIIWNYANLSIWKLSSKVKICQVNNSYGYKVGVAYNRKYIAFTREDGKLILYSSEKLEAITSFNNCHYLMFSHWGRYIACQSNLWNLKFIDLSKGKDAEIFSEEIFIDFYPNEKYILAKPSISSPELWKISLNSKVNNKLISSEQIIAASFSDNSQFFAILTIEGWISMFFMENQKLLNKFQVSNYPCQEHIAWSDTVLATTFCNYFIKFWNIYDGSLFKQIQTSLKSKWIEFSPDGKKIISCGDSSDIEIFDIDKNIIIFRWKSDYLTDTKWLWSRLGNYVISVSNWTIKTWKLENQELLAKSKVDIECNIIVSQSFCGNFLISCDFKTKIDIWYLGDKKITKVKEIFHDYNLNTVAWSEGSKNIIAEDNKGNIIVWDYNTGKEIKKIKAHKNKIPSINASKRGYFISFGDQDAKIKLWKFY